MHSSSAALAWEFWARHRLGLSAVLALVLGFALYGAIVPLSPNAASLSSMWFVMALCYVVGVFAYGFDLLAFDGDDLRSQPLDARTGKLVRLLARSVDGIMLTEHIDGELGPVMFKRVCRMGLEGIVSKRRDKPYRSKTWLKIKNPARPAARRVSGGGVLAA